MKKRDPFKNWNGDTPTIYQPESRIGITLPETDKRPLKIDEHDMSSWDLGLFSGAFAVSFRGSTLW